MIKVQTQTTKTLCHFEEGDFMLVDPSISHTLRPVIQGQEDIITRITWKCNIVTSAAPCPDFDAPEMDFETT